MAHDFFQNKQCPYFPCHKKGNPETFSCILCFCPLYSLGENCGGNFTYTELGIKDCSNCLRPHQRENYSGIMDQLTQVIELAKKKPHSSEKP